jgi:hypothetical protein
MVGLQSPVKPQGTAPMTNDSVPQLPPSVKLLRDAYRDEIANIAEQHNTDIEAIFAPNRGTANVALARFHCYDLLRSDRRSVMEIARCFGRDHSTIGHGIAVMYGMKFGQLILDCLADAMSRREVAGLSWWAE